LLSFAYVYFLESGLFNGLRPIQKNFFLPSDRHSHRLSDIPFPFLAASAHVPIFGSATGNGITLIPVWWKKLFRISDSREDPAVPLRSLSLGRPLEGPPLQLRKILLCAGLVSTEWRTRMRIPIILAFLPLGLSGCNANQAVNPSSQPASQVFAGHYVDYNPYDPISYAQNNTGRGGGR
jgi:hypothetical protein